MGRGYSHFKFPKIIASANLEGTYFFQLSWMILIIFELFSFVQTQPPVVVFVLKTIAQFSWEKPLLEPL